jgi:hypothetical protein
MAHVIYEVYDALRSVGVDELKAKSAAEAMSRDNERLMRVEKDIETLKSDARQIKFMLMGLYLGVVVTIVQGVLR